ncbi:MAG: hypothetical protein ACTSXH_07025 [Promethearchaeota archaeon]
MLEWTPITFAIEFIYRMRKLKEKLLYLPSMRQAIAIPKLLTAMYYRKINLIPEDFIKAAVITTPIEDQEIAEKVAFEIIFGIFFKSNTHIVKEFKDDKNLEDLADELLDLTARGGTRVQKALEWGGEQLKESTSELIEVLEQII